MPVAPANRHNLSRGLVTCTIRTDEPIPSDGFAVLAVLAAAVATADDELQRLIRVDQAQRPGASK